MHAAVRRPCTPFVRTWSRRRVGVRRAEWVSGPSSRSKPCSVGDRRDVGRLEVEVAGEHPRARAGDQEVQRLARAARAPPAAAARGGSCRRSTARRRTTTTARTSTRRSPSPGELDHLALDHLAAHHRARWPDRRGTRAWRGAHTSSPPSASASCAPWSAKRVRQRRWSSSWKRPHVGGQAAQRRRRPAVGAGRPTGSGTPCWRFAVTTLTSAASRRRADCGDDRSLLRRQPRWPRPPHRRRHLRARRGARGHA